MFVCVSGNENFKNGLKSFFLDKECFLPFSLVQMPIFSVHSDSGFCTFRIDYCTFRTLFFAVGFVFCTFGFCTLGLIFSTLGTLTCTLGLIICTNVFIFSTNGVKV